MRRLHLVAVAVALALTGGCGATAPLLPAPVGAGPTSVAVAVPATLRIPRLGIDTPLMGVGLAPDGTLATPPVDEPGEAAWYELGVRPGEPGPAIVLGHVSGRPPGLTHSIPGIFAHLDQVRPGDRVEIGRTDGTVATFLVTRTELAPKAAFPTAEVYGDTAGPELRLITCGGEFDLAAHNYLSNRIVFASLAP